MGCNLSCYYCWSKKPREKPGQVGKFYSPSEVRKKLVKIAREHDFYQVRLSENEPTIGKEHLLVLLEEMDGTGLNFILETNGILLGADPSYVHGLNDFRNLHVRVSLKGCDSEQFLKLTGAEPEGFDLQIQSLQNLTDSGVSCNAAVMKDFAKGEKLAALKGTLEKVDPLLARGLELEKLILYPHVRNRLKRAGTQIPQE